MTGFFIIGLLFFRISFGLNDVENYRNSAMGSVKLRKDIEAFDFSGSVSLAKGEVVRVAREFEMNSREALLVFKEDDLRPVLIFKSGFDGYKSVKSDVFFRREPLQSVRPSAENSVSFALTVDLCSKPLNPELHFEKGFFEALKRESMHQNRAIPVAIAISGRWLKKSEREFSYLKALHDEGFLAITWVNHSMHHELNDGKFLTSHETNFREEVLDIERMLLIRGVMPSAFFRFPGLVSTPALLDELAGFSLIPLGADAWLAKGQKLHDGAIVLIHGNGNEPLGIRLFLKEKRFFGGISDIRTAI